uniref:Uncharacterized protein n=1 Tax=Parastrongyloides trichosuri TaxID=131310 RepID=A0A0N4Z6K7_PARTI
MNNYILLHIFLLFLFSICCLINLLLCAVLIFISINGYEGEDKIDWALIFSFSIFIFLTISLIIAYISWRRTEKDFLLILCVTFTIGQCLCIVVTGIAFFANETYSSSATFEQNPYRWLESNRWITISTVIFLLPVYLCQLFVINRYAGREYRSMPTNNHDDIIIRKKTPYNNSQKKFKKIIK